jgi:hypothetical protein
MKTSLFLLVLALLGACSSACANVAAGTPLFTWDRPVVSGGAALKETRITCDGDVLNPAVIQLPALTWQSTLGLFSAGVLHSCAAAMYDTANVLRGQSNTVTFTIPTPVVPFHLEVQ